MAEGQMHEVFSPTTAAASAGAAAVVTQALNWLFKAIPNKAASRRSAAAAKRDEADAFKSTIEAMQSALEALSAQNEEQAEELKRLRSEITELNFQHARDKDAYVKHVGELSREIHQLKLKIAG